MLVVHVFTEWKTGVLTIVLKWLTVKQIFLTIQITTIICDPTGVR